MCRQEKILALGPRFGLILGAKQCLLWLPEVAIWADFNIFKILVGAGHVNNSISVPNYCDGSSLDFGPYTSKVSSAWTEVWNITWCPTASIMAPGGRDLDDF